MSCFSRLGRETFNSPLDTRVTFVLREQPTVCKTKLSFLVEAKSWIWYLIFAILHNSWVKCWC